MQVNVTEAIASRMSCRAFLPTPIERLQKMNPGAIQL
jgi:hypothetical protein